MSVLLHGSGPLSVNAVHGTFCGTTKIEFASIGLGLEEGMAEAVEESAAESLSSSSSTKERAFKALDKAATSFLSS